MKILYAVQATGNGHIARASELLPYLQKHGEVDVFLSGSNSSLDVPLPVKYRSKGLSLFYGKKGGLNYLKMAGEFSPLRMWREAKALPVEKYDIVINDFEAITTLACNMKKKAFIHFGHQASFASLKTPRPGKKDPVGEFILRSFAGSENKVGLHFHSYDDFIYSPVLKERIVKADPVNKGHVTVYLSHYSDEFLASSFELLPEVEFHVFSKTKKTVQKEKNITYMPVNNEAFTGSMIQSAAVITGAGFETPAEALYLHKKLMCIPIRGQYEQLCNAAALEWFNVPVPDKVDALFALKVRKWLNGGSPLPLFLNQSTEEIVQTVIEKGLALSRKDLTEEPVNIFMPDGGLSFPEYSI